MLVSDVQIVRLEIGSERGIGSINTLCAAYF